MTDSCYCVMNVRKTHFICLWFIPFFYYLSFDSSNIKIVVVARMTPPWLSCIDLPWPVSYRREWDESNQMNSLTHEQSGEILQTYVQTQKVHLLNISLLLTSKPASCGAGKPETSLRFQLYSESDSLVQILVAALVSLSHIMPFSATVNDLEVWWTFFCRRKLKTWT